MKGAIRICIAMLVLLFQGHLQSRYNAKSGAISTVETSRTPHFICLEENALRDVSYIKLFHFSDRFSKGTFAHCYSEKN